MQTLYTAQATAYGGRNGRITSDDDRLDIEVAPPPELGGPADGYGTNPEQLFAAGYAGCFMSAMQLVAARMKVDMTDASVTAKVQLLKEEDKLGFTLGAELVATLPKASREDAEAVVARSHEVCPYSRATRGNIEVALTVG
jgi:lipoyl-dependent peroxiredoxin